MSTYFIDRLCHFGQPFAFLGVGPSVTKKKSKSGVEGTQLLTLTCMLSSIVCPSADHLPSSSSLLRGRAWRGLASWVSHTDLMLSEPNT